MSSPILLRAFGVIFVTLGCACQGLTRQPWVYENGLARSDQTLHLLGTIPGQYPDVVGFPGVRGRAGYRSENLQASFEQGLRQRARVWQAEWDAQPELEGSYEPRYEVLVLGAGGPNGSFGAGLLYGWSQTGQRPEFDVVTGVSAGALLAPFAFVGAPADEDLRKAFERLEPADIYREKGLVLGLLGESLMDSAPLAGLIRTYVDAEMMEAIAAGHEAGRRLYIGTTDFDLGKLVIWDVGAIAIDRTPEALHLVRQVLLASSAIPVFYPPVLFPVEDGRGGYGDELHVDGALASPMFLPTEVVDTWGAGDGAGLSRFGDIQLTITVIHNGAMEPSIEAIERSTVDIALRSFLMVSWSMVQEDVRLLFLLSKIWGAQFRFACIPYGGEVSVLDFEPSDAQRLFETGLARGRDPRGLETPPPVSLVQKEWYGIQPMQR